LYKWLYLDLCFHFVGKGTNFSVNLIYNWRKSCKFAPNFKLE
jgi:hypothetical protein